MKLQSFAEGRWHTASEDGKLLRSAVTGEPVAEISSVGLDYAGMLAYARDVGGANLRKLTFHDRAFMLKALAKYLLEYKEEFYRLSYATGATRKDGWIDIEGGISTLFVYSSKGRREMPDERHYIDGPVEPLSKHGTFVGQHICTPLEGAAIHINAYNFPCWGMLEKLAPTLLAGVPAIVKPASSTAYLTELMFQRMIASGILPEGSLQLICGGTGDLLDHVTGQDVISFTGSAATAHKLTSHPRVIEQATRFIAETDSLNSAVLGTDAAPDTPEFDLFIKEVAREMTVKAGQKCTAIRKAIVPKAYVNNVIEALRDRLASTAIGDPEHEAVRMGALASHGQREEVRERVRELAAENDIVAGDLEEFDVLGADRDKGSFLPPILMHCERPFENLLVHHTEAFGPVSTVVPYDTLDDAIRLTKLGEGSLAGSVFAYDNDVARELLLGMAPYHGRIVCVNRDCAKESTGHGSPLPHLVHGGPGRAGGGEEMGGIRGVLHYMQRTALQGSPTTLTATTRSWIRGAQELSKSQHPFRKTFEELDIGETLHTDGREVTLADIEHFAHFTGDTFYAHMNEDAAKANPFFADRVAHGYFLISCAAGLFVDPDPGPVLANYGLDNLRFLQPVYAGDVVKVRLTAKQKTLRRGSGYGEVRWDVEMTNQDNELCATYDLLTMNQSTEDKPLE